MNRCRHQATNISRFHFSHIMCTKVIILTLSRRSLFGGLDLYKKLCSSDFKAAHTLLHHRILISHELNSGQTAITRHNCMISLHPHICGGIQLRLTEHLNISPGPLQTQSSAQNVGAYYRETTVVQSPHPVASNQPLHSATASQHPHLHSALQ